MPRDDATLQTAASKETEDLNQGRFIDSFTSGSRDCLESRACRMDNDKVGRRKNDGEEFA
jgi:hypothetical protein